MEASGRVAGMTITDDHTRKNRSANDVPKPVREQDQERGRTGAFKTAEAEQWHTVSNRRKSGNERTKNYETAIKGGKGNYAPGHGKIGWLS